MVFPCILTFLRLLGGRRGLGSADSGGEEATWSASALACAVDRQHGEHSDNGSTASQCSSAASSGGTTVAPPWSDLQQAEEVAPMTQASLEEFMNYVSSKVMSWEPDAFVHVKTLQDAIKNHTHVDHMLQSLGGSVRAVAAKRLPNRWMQSGPQEFRAQQPGAAERPWCDLGIVEYLNSIRFPYACELLGVFRDEENTYAVTSLATHGNLFYWCDCEPGPGPSREAVILPIAWQIFSAISWLHELGLAHRDISLENILLTEATDGILQVKIIDFAMATPRRKCYMEVRGKASYQAPEMHTGFEYDAFLADVFSLGVTMFAMALRDYPWGSTRPDSCALFGYVRRSGLRKFFEKRRLRAGVGDEHLADVLSPAFTDLLEGLLQIEPCSRLTLGEPCFDDAACARPSVWDTEWLRGGGPLGAQRSGKGAPGGIAGG
mmetsp:Transcript_25221/g.75280  ORF Transcript_25221/g.75280 Transcript_25221/m.75280 type:complete len:434 (-) Transcript_25221:18-1319(-)